MFKGHLLFGRKEQKYATVLQKAHPWGPHAAQNGSARQPWPYLLPSAAVLRVAGWTTEVIAYTAASASFLSGKQKLRKTQYFIHNKEHMFCWFFSVTRILVKLHSFEFIQGKTAPSPLGCRQSLSRAAIPTCQGLPVPAPFYKCSNCKTHRTTY